MAERANNEQSAVGGKEPAEDGGTASQTSLAGRRTAGLGLLLGALGVVYGDIGTSPLYALKTVFTLDRSLTPDTPDVFGVISWVFWSIILIVSVKYVIFILRADNEGEGGVMALAALARRALLKASERRAATVLALGALGAALFYGDSVITPAISVLSAVEGLEIISPTWAVVVLPVSAVILTLLFAIQRWGTGRVGAVFGPIMLLWFACLAVAGAAEVLRHPSVLAGLSPTYAALFVVHHPVIAFIAMGAVVLAITGAEALYADMGHFGRAPIRRAWFAIVFPALTLNYLGQGALILRAPDSRENPFFLLLPGWAQLPMVILATVATVIASQSVISGAFSVSREAMRLGFLPHLRIRHTSRRAYGQIYAPGVNWSLFAAVLLVTFAFGSSTNLAAAYGVAVTGTFLITTTLFLVVAWALWHWPTWRLVLFGVVFGSIELTFFTANLAKVTHGGWLTLLIAIILFTVLLTWRRGAELVTARRTEREGPLRDFIDTLHATNIPWVPGTAVFPHPNKETTPLALRANVAHNHVRHDRIVIITGRTANVPHIPWDQRLTIDDLGDPNDGIIHITAVFGFQDPTDFPEVMRRAATHPLAEGFALDEVYYFVSRITLRCTRRPGMAIWRKRLFIALAHNAASQTEFLHLPEERTVVLSAEIPV
ncbi:potassium transporter Kup [Micromonospora inositola]|uniref:Probable potassium transport system protein Kup n=1 Tax=Micromonospora inositola TaxID=47865 RepID=A0A1C5HZI8_9ACTN|nr:KUP/HAK/KT family potassium transporter [Micromonospora inositola]SCG51410.1 KUP system potassium uptake protein [Micromonospora inositola]